MMNNNNKKFTSDNLQITYKKLTMTSTNYSQKSVSTFVSEITKNIFSASQKYLNYCNQKSLQ